MKTLFVVTIASFAVLFMTQLAPARGFGGAHGSFGHSEESFGGRSREGENSDGFSREGGNSRGRQEGGGESGGFHANEERSGGNDAGGGQAGRNRAGDTEDRGRQQRGQYSNSAEEGAAASHARRNNGNPQASGAEGAAAGAAHTNRNEPPHSGAQGAAAETAAANRNEPSHSGAQGAAAGAAAANRNQPSYSGAQGAAAGAAVANRNAPAYSGVQGAAAGAAIANRNAPTYSGAQGAAAGYAAGVGNYQGGSVGLPTDAGYGLMAAGAGAVVANHKTVPISGSALAAGGAAVRSSYAGVGAFNQGWYGAHPNAWTAAGWTAARAWSPTTFAAVVPTLGWPSNVQPVDYDYGTNVTYQGDQVYYGNQPVATAEQYYQQAATLAQSVPAGGPQATDWTPLGVFALTRNEQDAPHYVMQLALDKSGAIAGNYCDLVSDTVHPIHGSVDKKTQRVAWMVGSNTRTVGEVGLVNLTQNEAPVLIHIGQNKTQQWMLVRLKQPAR